MSTGDTSCPAAELVDLVAATQGGAHRPIHAAGIGLSGTFSPAPGATSFSRAVIFSRPETRVTVRFSDGTGQLGGDQRKPDVRGLAVRFHLGATPSDDLDMIAMTLPGFFASNPEQFESFTRVTAPSVATGVPSADAIVQWLSEHPRSAWAFEWTRKMGIDVSYGAVRYFGVHAFKYTNAEGQETFAKFMWVPDHPVDPLPRDTDLSHEPADRLRREITNRARTGSAPGFALVAQLPGDGDSLTDPTLPWASKDVRPLGHLQLGSLVSDQYWDCEGIHFNPTRLVDGIDVSDDPILKARGDAYAVSAERRCAAYPAPSRVPSASME